jgi:hypothetical protein
MNYDLIGFSLWIGQINKCRIPKSRKMLFYRLSKQVDQAESCIFNTNIYNEGSDFCARRCYHYVQTNKIIVHLVRLVFVCCLYCAFFWLAIVKHHPMYLLLQNIFPLFQLVWNINWRSKNWVRRHLRDFCSVLGHWAHQKKAQYRQHTKTSRTKWTMILLVLACELVR